MTNAYDTRDLDDDPRAQLLRRGDSRDSMPEAAAIRSRLAASLRASVDESQNLATSYSNLSHTLEVCLFSWRRRSDYNKGATHVWKYRSSTSTRVVRPQWR